MPDLRANRKCLVDIGTRHESILCIQYQQFHRVARHAVPHHSIGEAVDLVERCRDGAMFTNHRRLADFVRSPRLHDSIPSPANTHREYYPFKMLVCCVSIRLTCLGSGTSMSARTRQQRLASISGHQMNLYRGANLPGVGPAKCFDLEHLPAVAASSRPTYRLNGD
jgi:hypothetical protein